MNNDDIGKFFQTLYQNNLFDILESIFDQLEMFKAIPIEIDESWLDKNSNLIILYNIIQSQLPSNIL